MKYKIEIRPFSTAIVAWDVESPERHQAIRNYIQDELDGIERGESVFEIQYAQQATVWRAIYE